jgi:hypothetical protein
MRKSTSLFAGVSILALAALGCSTGVTQETFTATLSRGNETAGGATPNNNDGGLTATGTAEVIFDASVAKFTLTVNGLTGITAAHIHSPAAATATAQVSVYLFDGPATDANTAFTGVLNKSTFNQVQITAAASGTATNTFDALRSSLESHTAYANVHTTANGGGSIRGNF